MIGGAFLCFLEGVEKVLHMLEARKHKEDSGAEPAASGEAGGEVS
ncbi:hypothetical protein ACNKHV_12330 [Shigella flexneri]